MSERFSVDPDIRKASTLPRSFYSTEGVYRDTIEHIFARSWQWVADTDVVKTPGQTYPFTLLEGCLDEPLLFSRDADDRIHAMSNVCTHRANLVCEMPGYERFLRCRYHGRRFGLDGRFQHMPEFEGCEGFPSAADDLPAVPFGIWRKFLFAGVRPFCSLEELLAPMEARVGWMPIEQFTFAPGRAREYLVQAHWALYVDNYLEGFHIPFIHSGLAETLDYGNYRTEIFPWCNLQLGVASGGEYAFDLPAGSPDHGQRIAAYYFWVFPNLMFNFYPWGLSINVVRPLGPSLTKVQFLPYVWDESKLASGAGAALDRVEREDEVVVESVQRGLRSRFYDRGRFSPAREEGPHHFQRLLAKFLDAASGNLFQSIED